MKAWVQVLDAGCCPECMLLPSDTQAASLQQQLQATQYAVLPDFVGATDLSALREVLCRALASPAVMHDVPEQDVSLKQANATCQRRLITCCHERTCRSARTLVELAREQDGSSDPQWAATARCGAAAEATYIQKGRLHTDQHVSARLSDLAASGAQGLCLRDGRRSARQRVVMRRDPVPTAAPPLATAPPGKLMMGVGGLHSSRYARAEHRSTPCNCSQQVADLLFGPAMRALVHAALGTPGFLFNDQVSWPHVGLSFCSNAAQ